jgi:hypothetical protein
MPIVPKPTDSELFGGKASIIFLPNGGRNAATSAWAGMAQRKRQELKQERGDEMQGNEPL